MKTPLRIILVGMGLSCAFGQCAHAAALQQDLTLMGMANILKAGSAFTVQNGATFTNTGLLNGAGAFDFSAATLTFANNQVGWTKVNKTGSSLADLSTRLWSDLQGKPTTLAGAGITDAQPLDTDLTQIAALTTTSYGRSTLSLADAVAGRAYFGVVIGTNVQAWSANLDTWSAKTPYAGALAITTAKTLAATNTLTLAGTDGSTLNVGAGGTLGTNAYIASIDVATFGAAPAASASVNTAAFASALALAGRITVTTPGTYQLNATLTLKSHTRLELAPGVTLQKTGNYYFMFVNEHASGTGSIVDSDISITGGALDFNSIAPVGWTAETLPIVGMCAHVAFRNATQVTIDGVSCANSGAGFFMLHFAKSDKIAISGSTFTGAKDAVHLSGGADSVRISRCTFSTADDSIALNAWDYSFCTPQCGDITNVIIEQCTGITYLGGTARGIRLLPGSWLVWAGSSSYQYADTVTNAGYQYRKSNTGTATASVAPTHTTLGQVVTGADGIAWTCAGAGTQTKANIANVRIDQWSLNAPAGVFFIPLNNDSFGRSEYPGTEGTAKVSGVRCIGTTYAKTSAAGVSGPIGSATAATNDIEISDTVFDANFLPSSIFFKAAYVGLLKLARLSVPTWPNDASGRGWIYSNSNDLGELVVEDCTLTGLASYASGEGMIMLLNGAGGFSKITVNRGNFANISSLFHLSSTSAPAITITGASFGALNRLVFLSSAGTAAPMITIRGNAFSAAAGTGLVGNNSGTKGPILFVQGNAFAVASTLLNPTAGTTTRVIQSDAVAVTGSISGPVAGDRVLTASGWMEYSGTGTLWNSLTAIADTTDATSLTAASWNTSGGAAVTKQLRVGGLFTRVLAGGSSAEVISQSSASSSPTFGWQWLQDEVSTGDMFLGRLTAGTQNNVMRFARASGDITMYSTTEATVAGAGSFLLPGGLRAAKKIITMSTLTTASGYAWDFNAATATTITSPDKSIKVTIGGTDYYLPAKLTNN